MNPLNAVALLFEKTPGIGGDFLGSCFALRQSSFFSLPITVSKAGKTNFWSLVR